MDGNTLNFSKKYLDCGANYNFLFSKLLILFFFLFLFSNLITRISGFSFNGLFYLVWCGTFVFSISKSFKNKMFWIIGAWATYQVLFVADLRGDPYANFMSIKDFVIPTLSFAIGLKFVRDEKFFNYLNVLYFISISYGVLQIIVYLTFSMETILPWDSEFISNFSEIEGGGNLFQGGLLRFFGTMNSFVEFQISVVFLLFLIFFIAPPKIRVSKIMRLNIFLAVVFLLISMERTPIFMAIITLTFVFLPVRKNLKVWWLVPIFSVLALIFSLFVINKKLEMTPFSSAFTRISNIVFLEFKKDEALNERFNNQWLKSIALMDKHFWGITVGRVAPGGKANNYFAPHNNYFVFYLGYGCVGLILFLMLIVALFYSFSVRKKTIRWFVYGVIFSFLFSSFFNLPFSGRQGIIFFILMGAALEKND